MKKVLLFTLLVFSLNGASFTISSYNCGALPGHYDYLRACCMQKVMGERFHSEYEWMETYEKVEQIAARTFLSIDGDRDAWREEGYEDTLQQFLEPNPWQEWAKGMISPYNELPVVLNDMDVQAQIQNHLAKYDTDDLEVLRKKMAQEILHQKLSYDVICFQEANLISQDLLPQGYASVFTDEKSCNGIAWNCAKFTLIKELGRLANQNVAVLLREEESGKTVLVASAHLRGCNPYYPTNGDSDQGDTELKTLVSRIEGLVADLVVVGMDSNVVATHPRLQVLSDYGYRVDYENALEPTCTNPHYLMNTRIDWIAVKGDASITNIPVIGVGLNSMETNMSDHKPIASIIQF